MTNLALQTQNATPFNTAINTSNNVPTMTSLEIVEFINNHRQANGNNTVLRHDNFMTKVPQVLGESLAPKFLGTSFYVNGAGNQVERQIYIFPKREACLMAMSYSYDIQAEIYDRMTALEQQVVFQPQLPNFLDPAEAALAWAEQYKAKKLAETQLIEAQQVIEIQAPKAEIFDAYLDKSRTYTIREFAQHNGVKEKLVKEWIVEKKWATGSCGKTFRPAAWSNVHNYMRMVRSGKPFTNAYGQTIYNETIAFTQAGFDEAVRKMIKAGIMKPLNENKGA